MLLLPEETRVFEHAQVARRGGPAVLETFREVTGGGGAPAKVEREQDLTAGGVGDRRNDPIERFELLLRGQTGSTSQMVSSSSTGPIGSHTAMTSGV